MSITHQDVATTLEARINALTELSSQIAQMRHFTSVDFNNLLPARFDEFSNVAKAVRSEAVQSALVAAEQSTSSDSIKAQRRRRRPCHKAHPELPSTISTSASLSNSDAQTPRPGKLVDIPEDSERLRHLKLFELIPFLREFNSANGNAPLRSILHRDPDPKRKCKLHIFTYHSRTPSERHPATTTPELQGDEPIVVRFCIPDILAAYITLEVENGALMPQYVTCVSPREKKLPHSHSDFLVYRTLSKRFSAVLHGHPTISFPALICLLSAYSTLFNDLCAGCKRVLSLEEHEPAVIITFAKMAISSPNTEGAIENGDDRQEDVDPGEAMGAQLERRKEEKGGWMWEVWHAKCRQREQRALWT